MVSGPLKMIKELATDTAPGGQFVRVGDSKLAGVTRRFAGKGSEAITCGRVIGFVAGFVTVKVISLVSLNLILGGEKVFVMTAGTTTLMLADAGPVGLKLLLSDGTLTVLEPTVTPTRFTVMLHAWFNPRTPVAKVMVLAPAFAVTVPPHVPAAPPGATCRPGDNVAVNANPVKPVLLS